ncbi:murein biosynthesis integral membrane protein MurJ [Cycloclasticus pugetii]|uniref:murein biosynthesis integral membrane protein MurJ n=1 Tax=Cycloclasticus pugetii TaxID=34068 RepID=UPI000475B31B|nr:murein biosynthesis integral membrane protein MurJ [Cycloclasticus pugetii]
MKSTAIVGSMTLISRVLGFVRDIVIARFFGASEGTDAFFVAFKIPNFMRRLFAEGAFSQAFVPVLSEYKETQSTEALKELLGKTAGTLATVLFFITLLGVIGAPVLIYMFAPGFDSTGSRYELAVDMLRITFPYLFFISLTAMAGGVLNTYGKFAIPAVTPVLLNLSFLAAICWLSPLLERPIMALAWAVLLAGIAQLAFQFPYLKQLGLLPRMSFDRGHAGVKKIMKLMLPALFGVSVTQINLLVDTLLASFLVAGSVSWLYFSDRLVEFPLGIFGIALATVILPNLSKSHAAGKTKDFSASLDTGLRWVVFLGLPAAAGLFFLAQPMLATLFQYDAFTSTDVDNASLSLMAYSIGLPAFILVKVLVPGFTARQDMKTPVKIGIIAVVSNMLMSVVLVFFFQHAGLALATSLAAFVNAGLLFTILIKSEAFKPQQGWVSFVIKVLIANLVVGVIYAYDYSPVQWYEWGAFDRVLHLTLEILMVVLLYVTTAFLVGVRPRHLLLKGK